MNRKNVIELHNVLKDSKLGSMNLNSKLIILNNLRKTTPLFNTYSEDAKAASEKFKPEGFDDLLQKARENEGKSEKERTITFEEIANLNKMTAEFNKEMSAFITKIDEEEIEIIIEKLPKEDFGKFIEANESFEASKLILIPIE